KAPTNLAESLRRAGHELLVGLLWQVIDGRRQTVVGSSGKGTDVRRPLTLSELPSAVYRLPSLQVLTLIAAALETRGLIQLSLFGDPDREPLLRAAIARIQDRFGEEAIMPAASVGSGQRQSRSLAL